jgi:transcriptional regulator with XRE-family HTH domain
MTLGLGKRVSKNVKAVRIARGLSQQALADKTGLTVRYLSRLENSAQNITLDVLERLVHGLNCSTVELLGEEKEVSQKPPTKALDETIRFLQSLRSRL